MRKFILATALALAATSFAVPAQADTIGDIGRSLYVLFGGGEAVSHDGVKQEGNRVGVIDPDRDHDGGEGRQRDGRSSDNEGGGGDTCRS